MVPMSVPSVVRLLVPITLAWLLAGCEPSPGPVSPTATRTPSPSPSRPFVPPPSELGAGGYDPVLIGFCIDEERALGIEARLITQHVPPRIAEQRMREGARIASGQARILANEGHRAAAAAVRAWAAALLESGRLLGDGVETFEALDPATRALVKVNRYLDCELDA